MTLTATHPALEARKFAVKLFVEQGTDIDLPAFVPVFHNWIQQQSVNEHLLIDVASYGHVVEGPGVVLIAHEANIGVDDQGGRRGLLYVRKQALPGGFAERASRVIADTWSLARRLEGEATFAGKLRFNFDELPIRIHDRLRAPNTRETFEAVRPALEQVTRAAMGAPVQIDWSGVSDDLFNVTARRR